MNGVRLSGVSKRYVDFPVIDKLSLDIESWEFVVFLGPSGCGKSTLLRMIAGLESLDDGEIVVAGKRVDHLPPGARNVAMVFQQYALYPHMTVRENLVFGLRNARVPADEIERRIEAAAQRLEITGLLGRRPGQLSGGQRQRAAIARAIVKKPALFLFDEPLSNLDAALRARTRIELAQLHQQLGTTMIFVTHDQVEAMTLASRIVVINNRRIEQIGTPMEIYRRPATRFVASFVGTPRINLVPVRVLEPDGMALARQPGDPDPAAGYAGQGAGGGRFGLTISPIPPTTAIVAVMKSVTALEAKNRFGEVMEAARRQPISITRNGRPSVVVISAESYARRQRMDESRAAGR